MKKYVWWLAASCLVVVPCGGVLARDGDAAPVTASASRVPDAAQVRQRMSALSVPFEANTGQQDQNVAFTARTLGGTLFVTRAGVLVYSFPGLPVAGQDGREPIRKRGPGWVLTETLVDARPVVRGDAPSATRVSRFIGNDPSRWQTSIPTFDRVALGEVWPGIEVALVARGNNMEKLFTVAPGADARRIAIRLAGAERLELAADGALIAHTGNGPVSFTAPRAWQDIKGERKPVRVAYRLTGDRYGFHLRGYDRAYPVVIDPLLQATYLGGSGREFGFAIALDVAGNVFVAGTTESTNFPGVAGGAQAVHGGVFAGNRDAFVARLNNGLTTLFQATYLGGSGEDEAYAIALDASGNVFVAGSTASTNFPGTAGGPQAVYGGGVVSTEAGDAFVAKLDNGLTMLLQATYLGGNLVDEARAIALDAAGNVFVAGSTGSTNFPGTAGGAQAAYGQGFVARLNNGLTTLLQATYLGGGGRAITLDPAGNVFVAGSTSSFNFPGVTGGAQAVAGGGGDAFVVKLNNGLTTLFQATYLGGNAYDFAHAVALDASGNVFVAGITYSANFPGVAGGAQAVKTGAPYDAFVAKLNGGLTTLTQATYLGGTSGDAATAIAWDAGGYVFVAGYTASTNFPGTAGGAQSVNSGGGNDAFVARLKDNLTALTQATYLGGNSGDQANAIALDAGGYVFVAGSTTSTNFPGTAGGAQAVYGGGFDDAFVAKLTHGLHDLANSSANNDGDPHITTVGGIHYDFQSAGEFTVLRDGNGTQIQTRQSPVTTQPPVANPYTGLATCVSLNTAVAARVGTHRVTYQPNLSGRADPGGLQLRVDGVLTTLGAQPINLGPRARVMKSAAGNGIEIDFPDGTNLTATSNFWGPPHSRWYINVSVFGTEATEGIMGALASGSWLPALPDGASLGPKPAALPQRYVDLYQTFANAWRVTNATSLFDYAPGTSTATFTLASWPPQNPPCVAPESPPAKPVNADVAQKLCAQIVDKNRKANCVFDVGITGEPGFAKLYLVSQQIQAGATRTTVNDDKDPTLFGESVTFTATVALRASRGKGVPAGTVQFSLDGAKTGNPVKLNAKGQATWKTSRLAVGNHRVGAFYLPEKGSIFQASSSFDQPHAVSNVAKK